MGHKPATPGQRPDLTPTMLPALREIAIAGALVVVGAAGVLLVLVLLLNLSFQPSGKHAPEERKLLVEVFKVVLGVAAGFGAVVALALNYRRHRIEESQSHRDPSSAVRRV